MAKNKPSYELVYINWSLPTELDLELCTDYMDLTNPDVFNDDEIDIIKPISMEVQICGRYLDYINEEGLREEIFNKEVREAIIKHIKEIDGDLSMVLKFGKNIFNGTMILVFDCYTFKSNSYFDPEEWDSVMDFMGILGNEIKLVKDDTKVH